MTGSPSNLISVVLAPDLRTIATAVLLVFGYGFCYFIIRRIPSDIKEIRELHDTGRTAGIVTIWAVTAPIAATAALFTVRFAIITIRGNPRPPAITPHPASRIHHPNL